MQSKTPNPFRLAGLLGRGRLLAATAGRIRVLLDLRYGTEDRHRLDLYLPERPGFPVALFVHGGCWSRGDKSMFANVGSFLARHGIGAVLVNYRLAPQVCFPVHVQDVAAAFAWVRRRISSFGGDAGRMSLFGHSAGGHLVSLLATDGSHLRNWNLCPAAIQGVVTMSGIYHIGLNVTLYGLGHVFRGADRAAASPIRHVKAGCPPFLVLYAQHETWTLAGQARKLHACLLANNAWSRLVRVPGEDHDSILHSATVPGSPHGRQIVRFLLEG
jgi:acetyl esterase/lipase